MGFVMTASEFASRFVHSYWAEVASDPPEFAAHSAPCTESAAELLAGISTDVQEASTGELTVVMQNSSDDAWRFVFARRGGEWQLQSATSGTSASIDRIDLLDRTYQPSFGPFLQRVIARANSGVTSDKLTTAAEETRLQRSDCQTTTSQRMFGPAHLFAIISLVCGWLIGLGGWPLIIWSPLNCRHDEIDINSGRIRTQRFLAGVCISERVTESPVSLEVANTTARPDWRRVNTFSPFVNHSPHYSFHAAINQARELKIIWKLSAYTPEARLKSCQELLQRWQAGNSDDGAAEFIRGLTATVSKESQQHDGSAEES